MPKRKPELLCGLSDGRLRQVMMRILRAERACYAALTNGADCHWRREVRIINGHRVYSIAMISLMHPEEGDASDYLVIWELSRGPNHTGVSCCRLDGDGDFGLETNPSLDDEAWENSPSFKRAMIEAIGLQQCLAWGGNWPDHAEEAGLTGF